MSIFSGFKKLWDGVVSSVTGLFNDLLADKYFIQGHTQTLPVFKNLKKKPNPVRDAVLRATLMNRDVRDTVIATYFDSSTFDAKKCAAVARRRYPSAIPKGTVKPIVPSFSLIKDFMDTEFPINVHKYDEPVQYYIEAASIDYLRHNYILFGNKVLSPHNRPVVYNSIIYPDGHTIILYVRLYDGTDRYYKYKFTVPELYLSNTDLYYYIITHVQKVNDKKIVPNTLKLTVIRANDPKYKKLYIDKASAFTSFFPVIPIVMNNDLIAKPKTPAHAAIKGMTSALGGMSIDKINNAILANPSKRNIYSTYLTSMLDLETATSQAELEYMFKFFTDLRGRSLISMSNINAHYALHKNSTYGYMNSVIIQSNSFLSAFSYYEVNGGVVKGKVCKVGEYCRKIGYAPNIPVIYRIWQDTPQHKPLEIHIGQRPSAEQWIIIYKQISEQDYQHVGLIGVMSTTHLPLLKRKINSTLTGPGTNIYNKILVPIDMSVLNKMNRKNRDDILFKATRFVFESYTATKRPWYEKKIFSIAFQALSMTLGPLVELANGLNSLVKSLTGIDIKGLLGRIVKLAYEVSTLPMFVKLSQKYLGDEVTYKLIAVVSIISQIAVFAFTGNAAASALVKQWGDIASTQVGSSMQRKLDDKNKELRKRQEYTRKQIDIHRKRYGLDNDNRDIFRILQYKALYPNETSADYIHRTTLTDTVIQLRIEISMTAIDRSLDPEFYMMKTNMMRYSNQIMNNLS